MMPSISQDNLTLNSQKIFLDGETVTPQQLVSIGTGKFDVDLTPEAWIRIEASRNLVDKLAAGKNPVYGINTGFGNFATVSIPDDKLAELQENLIKSHAAGCGPVLSVARTRMVLALRINVLAKGFSGIRASTVKTMLTALNKSCLGVIHEKGTLSCSGDLSPLSELALSLLGFGDMWDPTLNRYDFAGDVLKRHGIEPLHLAAKEGLAMINGTQFITALIAESVVRAKNLVKCADIIGAMTLEALKGTPRAFDPKIHAARPHPGQIASAKRLRMLLNSEQYPSTLNQSHFYCNKVQDSYTLRCMPQVHGIAADTVEFVERIIQTEMNSATDNPMIFAETGESISGGNFHGEYPAKAADYLAIGIHELSSISERRIERLINPSLSGLPAFLVKEGGLNSGFMIAHCTAAALVSENKVLTHPSSVDSIPTSAAKEDHVAMGGMAARKLLEVVENVEIVLGIELLCACQAMEFLRPLQTTKPLETVHELVRTVVRPWDRDRVMQPDIKAAHELIKSGKVVDVVQEFIRD